MSKAGQDFIGLVPKQDTRPKASLLSGKFGNHNLIRDQLTISSWLCLGAIAQGVGFLIVGRLALIPAVAVVLYRVIDAYAMTVGWKRNTYMDGVLMKKFSAQFPDSEGRYGNKPADSDVVVFILGVRCNHPLGMLAPGFNTIGDHFTNMAKNLEEEADKYGYLGMTSWMNANQRATSSEIMSISYFRTPEGLHNYAHGPVHREGWNWWNREIKKQPHLSIFHETYHVPKGNWESITVNSHISGINTTTFKVTDKETGAVSWASPVVDASRGLLKTSAGRMSRSQGDEHDKYEQDPYQ